MSSKQSQSDSSLEDLLDLVMASLDEKYDFTDEAKDIAAYAQYLRKHIHQNKERFQERFSKGYEILLETLRQDREQVS